MADISSLGLIHGSGRDLSVETDVLASKEPAQARVGGVGMEMFDVKYNDLDLHHNDVMFDVHKTSMAHIITDLPGRIGTKKGR